MTAISVNKETGISVEMEATLPVQEFIRLTADSLRDGMQKAQLATNRDTEYILKKDSALLEKLAKRVNTNESVLNPEQAAQVIEDIASLGAGIHLNNEGHLEGSESLEFKRELRSIASYINSCRG